MYVYHEPFQSATFFNDKNCQGQSYNNFHPDITTLTLDVFEDQYVRYNTVKSISVPPGLKLMLYSEPYHQGNTLVYRNPPEADEAKCFELDQSKMPEVGSYKNVGYFD